MFFYCAMTIYIPLYFSNQIAFDLETINQEFLLFLKVSEYPQKSKILKATSSWFTVFLFDQNEREICFFLTKILFLYEI